MKRTIMEVFKWMGALVLTLLLWYFILGVGTAVSPVRRSLWDASKVIHLKDWSIRTGSEGLEHKNITEPIWNSAVDYSNR